MSRREQKIDTGGGEGLANEAFAGLNLGGLKPKAESGEPETKRPVPKQKNRGRVEVRREKAGRGGKTVTTLSAFPTHIPLRDLEALAFDLKKSCACGGTLRDRVIELQGDVRDRVMPLLEKAGFSPVRAGG